MKAVVLKKYGDSKHLVMGQKEKPIPKDNEVLIKVACSTVTAGDCKLRKLDFPIPLRWALRVYMGIIKPRDFVLGQELSGIVEAVGKDVTRLKPGDRVYGTTGFKMGAYAEYITLPEKPGMGVLALMPESMSFEVAAGLPVGGLEALYFLKKAGVKSGDKVLINGAGGSIGTLAIQYAKAKGASVIAVDNASKFDVLEQAGADRFIDYTQEDFTKLATYNIIFDVIGKSPFNASVACLEEGGAYMFSDWTKKHKLLNLFKKKQVHVAFGDTPQSLSHLNEMTEMYKKGQLTTIIDQVLPLDQVAKAHAYVEANKKKGSLIIKI